MKNASQIRVRSTDYSHPVQPEGLKGVGRAQQLEEVVRPEVVADETEDADPHVGLRDSQSCC